MSLNYLEQSQVGQSDSRGTLTPFQGQWVGRKIQFAFLSYGLSFLRFQNKNMHNTSKCLTYDFFFFKKKVTDQSELSSEMKDSNI